MREVLFRRAKPNAQMPHPQQAQVRASLLLLVLALVGVILATLWYFGYHRPSPEAQPRDPSVALSDSTRNILKHLVASVEIRFYSVLDPASVPASVREFAGRAGRLVAAYETEGGGKITVARFDSLSDASAQAASADGVTPFNLDKGDACYLGIAVVCEDRGETIPHLAPEWEPALESDLSRVIARVAARPPPPATTRSIAANAAATEEVKRLIPNPQAASLEEGSRILREAALKEFRAAVSDSDARLKAAQQRALEAQNGQSEAAQQDALKQLKQIQMEQTEKLQQIAARLQEQINALEQLKRTGSQ